MRLRVKVTPRSSRSEIVGIRNGILCVRLHSPPVDGAANEELISVISKALHIRRSDVRVVTGQSSRQKVLDVSADEATVRALGQPAVPESD